MRMKQMMALIIAIVMMLCCSVSASAASVAFTDIEDHWAEKSILRWTATGIINGYKAEDGTYEFKPNESIKRGEFAKIMSTVLGLTEEAENTFHDLDDGKWYTTYILRCAAAGIMQGDTQGNANPEQYITREQAFAMYTRTLEMDAGEEADLTGFTDAEMVAGWAAGSVAAMYNYNSVQGNPDGTLDPKGNLTRAQAVLILDRLIGVYVDAEGNVSTSSAAAEGMVCSFVVVNAQCQEDVKVETTVNAEGRTEIAVTVKEETVTVTPDNDKLPAVVVQDTIVSVDPEKGESVNVQGATEKENAVISTHTHSWDTLKLLKDTNCTEAGEVKYTCKCGESKTEAIPVMAEAHNFENGKCTICAKTHECKADYVEVSGLTCLEDGIYSWVCSCGIVIGTTEKSADVDEGHKYDANHVCTLCGTKLEDVSTEYEHCYVLLDEPVKDGSCTEKMVIRFQCACGKYEDKTLYVVHNWSNAGICWDCGMKKDDCEHEWSWGTRGDEGEICVKWCRICPTEEYYEHEWVLEVSDEWYHFFACKNCQCGMGEEHTYGTDGKCTACGYICTHVNMDWEITTPATCIAQGEATVTCECGYTTTEPVEVDLMNGHDYKIVGDLHVCTLCGDETADHCYDTCVQTKSPGCDTLGEDTFTCDCGDSVTQELPYSHVWDEEGVCWVCGMNSADCKHEYAYYFTVGDNAEYCELNCLVCNLTERKEHDDTIQVAQWGHYYECSNCYRTQGEDHVFDKTYTCVVCKYTCEHTLMEDCVCQACGYICTHDFDENSFCALCSYYCNEHEIDEKGKCSVCAKQMQVLVIRENGEEEYFEDAYAAITNSGGNTIKLLTDYATENFIYLGNSLELDLNGHTFTVSSIQIGSQVTIKDGTMNCYPAKTNGNQYMAWVFIVNDLQYQLTMEDVTVNAYMDENGDSTLAVFTCDSGTINVNGCTINAMDVNGNLFEDPIALYDGNGSCTFTNCTLNGCKVPESSSEA